MPYLPGAILVERYRILQLLGRGRLGATYRAYDMRDERDVALKEILDPSLETQKRLRREVRALARLTHSQRPTVLDHFAVDGVGQYVVTAYADGADLATLVAQFGRLPSEDIIGWLQDACLPLGDLHAHDRLHLDFKPANLRLMPTGEIMLVDPGPLGSPVPTGDPAYRAPELDTEGEVGVAADVYSLGATLYTLLTGEPPPDATRRAGGLADLKPARDLNPDVEPYLSVVAGRALSLRPDARYASAADFAQALNRPLGHREGIPPLRRVPDPAPPRPAPPPTSGRRQIQPRTLWGLVGLLTIITLTTIGLVLLDRFRTADVSPVEATATTRSEIVAALTELAPTATAVPTATPGPTPTPEPLIDPKTGARLIFIPPGLFRLGDDEGEPDEQPSFMVQLDAFYLDETEVTNAQYALCVDDGACAPPLSNSATFHTSYYGDPAFDDYPVIFVNWAMADTFCTWRDARLPSEAEWEYAAGYEPALAQKQRYPWGNEFDGARLNFCDANCTADDRDPAFDDGHQDTAPVGSYPQGRSPLGPLDMTGNVWEWVQDWYNPQQYRQRDDVNPIGPPTGEAKVIRGGSWLSTAEESTTSYRGRFLPIVARANVGFRCAQSPR